ncbi:hypothetical protein RxyAA322_14820 [Rubrobacter xylanophilus]|uniref:Bacterial spore germination immunoglobulin-like domain-containing protein n=1 Tax=Rubrobacter xylanophilus TaxID=49319 RepID=A0A510HI90_9ACTN|nr:Gmad2 immunoglobulin-like domain-containing protein [Rubrobacter xylanophilus]BBL79628.1 hypothetical protein RxyAA322_14820 [Rubrobacter xylanophilus]
MIIRIRQTPGLALFGLALFALLVLSSCARQGGSEESAGRQNDRVREDTAVQTVSEESSRSPTEAAPREKSFAERTVEESPDRGKKEEQATPSAGEGGFTAAPEASGGEEGAARTIAEVRFGRHQGYERAVIEFDSPRVPRWSLSTPLGEGYSRISLPDIETARQTGGDFGGQIMADYYVVRNPQGGFFVDVFATGPFRYRLLELQNPGRLVLDYAPAGGSLARPLPVRGERNVVMEPRPGQAVSGTLVVSGYSRNFEALTTVLLQGPDGSVLARKNVTASAWSEAWGYFETTVEVPPFRGEATLLVGAESPRDGTFQGIEVPVVYGG